MTFSIETEHKQLYLNEVRPGRISLYVGAFGHGNTIILSDVEALTTAKALLDLVKRKS